MRAERTKGFLVPILNTCRANDRALEENRKIISGQDIINAMEEIEMPQFVQPLKDAQSGESSSLPFFESTPHMDDRLPYHSNDRLCPVLAYQAEQSVKKAKRRAAASSSTSVDESTMEPSAS